MSQLMQLTQGRRNQLLSRLSQLVSAKGSHGPEIGVLRHSLLTGLDHAAEWDAQGRQRSRKEYAVPDYDSAPTLSPARALELSTLLSALKRSPNGRGQELRLIEASILHRKDFHAVWREAQETRHG